MSFILSVLGISPGEQGADARLDRIEQRVATIERAAMRLVDELKDIRRLIKEQRNDRNNRP
jgi:hypothetical protein